MRSPADLLRRIPALLFPQGNACHLCQRALTLPNEHELCEACQRRLAALRLPREEAVQMLDGATPCASAYRYEDEARELDLRLKYGGDRAAALPLAEGLCGAFLDAAELRGANLVAPVPLHPRRERERGYNQAELLARAFCAHTGLPLEPHALVRVRNTKPQTGKTREQRLVGVADAFAASQAARGKRVLLIDDVLTTGATLRSCAEALLAGGAWDVTALTVSRARE